GRRYARLTPDQRAEHLATLRALLREVPWRIFPARRRALARGGGLQGRNRDRIDSHSRDDTVGRSAG
ncbi:MAG: hypothetical protein KGY40_03935, partial [Thioalkalivibrio sp.]|nr:hypothetical protein [Thioalkalivibrio sp.]